MMSAAGILHQLVEGADARKQFRAQRPKKRADRRYHQQEAQTNGRRKLARPERFELPTYCSGGNRSIQLSYGRAISVYMRGREAINRDTGARGLGGQRP